ncbi:MAG: FtsX-like permease family protein, partial [Paracoccaceae bacterium]
MMGPIWQALWSHWRRAPLQLVAVVFGLALSTALWSGVQAINAEARASYDAAATTLGEGRYDQILPTAGDSFDQASYIALRRAGWLVSPVVEGHWPGAADGPRLRVIGLDPLTAPVGLAPVDLAGSGAQPAVDLAAFLGGKVIVTHPADQPSLTGQTDVPVVALASAVAGVALMDIGLAQHILNAPDRISRLIVAPEQPMGLPPLADVAPGLTLRRVGSDTDVAQLTDSFHLNLTAFGLLSFVVGLFIVQGTVRLAFEQRRGLVRSLRAMGVPLHHLIAALVAEIIALALLAGIMGVVLGYVMAAVLLPDVAATLDGLYGAQVAGSVQLRPIWWLSGLAMAVGGALIAAAGAIWHIARMPILSSARPRAWAEASRAQGRVMGGVAAVLLSMAAVLALWGDGLVSGFVLLACLLVGAALALPPLLRAGLAAAFAACEKRMQRQGRSPIWSWFWADTIQQVPGLSLALMALLLATSANVGVSTMVSSFRLTFQGFLDQRLAPELYLSFDTVAQAQAAAAQAAALPDVTEVLPVVSVRQVVAGQPAQVFGVRVGPTYRSNWRFLSSDGPAEDVWTAVDAGQAVVVNEQLARRADLWPGARVTVAPAVTLPVRGVVADYGNPLGQVVLAEDVFATLYPDAQATRFGLRTQVPQQVRAALVGAGMAKAAIVDQARIKAFSLDVFDRTFTVTAALNVLTLAVAGFAILMSLLTLAAQRVPQLAPVWALGVTRAMLGRLELVRTLALAVFTVVLAVPLGLALAWVLLNIVNVAAFGW